jgi:hypothetical protein
VRLAPLLFAVTLLSGCGAPAGSPAMPAAAAVADTEEISLEISALM